MCVLGLILVFGLMSIGIVLIGLVVDTASWQRRWGK